MLSPKFLERMVILCVERRHPKQNSVIRLKSNILIPQIFRAGYASACYASNIMVKYLQSSTATQVQITCFVKMIIRLPYSRQKCTMTMTESDFNDFSTAAKPTIYRKIAEVFHRNSVKQEVLHCALYDKLEVSKIRTMMNTIDNALQL